MKVVNKMQRFEAQLYQINLKQRDTATISLSMMLLTKANQYNYNDFLL